jgi:prepilin-type N-terminal cleavage/methylation domain-containing protein
MQQARGFTLLELMVVMVVLAILAGIALPSYTDYVVRGRLTEGYGNLADLRIRMEQFYMDNRRYDDLPASGICGIVGGNTPSTSARYFTYECLPGNLGGLGAQGYVLTARGVAAQGLAGISYTVTQMNVRATQVDAGSDMANRGYAAAACWVRKKPAEC